MDERVVESYGKLGHEVFDVAYLVVIIGLYGDKEQYATGFVLIAHREPYHTGRPDLQKTGLQVHIAVVQVLQEHGLLLEYAPSGKPLAPGQLSYFAFAGAAESGGLQGAAGLVKGIYDAQLGACKLDYL